MYRYAVFELLLVVIGAAIGGAGVWWSQRSKHEQQLEDKRMQLTAAQSRRSSLERRLALRDEQLDEVEKQRDDYAQIASSHELVRHKWTPGQWVRKVWKDRRYAGHPSDNLESLVKDFEDFGDEHVLTTLDIELFGGWKDLLGGKHEATAGAVTMPMSAGQSMLFEGPADRVIKQIVTFLRDDDTGFVAVGDEGEKHWRDTDSPMTWKLTVDVLEGYASPPEAKFVEVLRVQKEIVERPVVQSVPDEVASSLCNHTREEIVTLIEAVLEVRELDRPRRIEALTGKVPKALRGAPH